MPALVAYLLLGPGLWLLFALSMGLAQARMSRLRRPGGDPESRPVVSVLVPAKDEGAGIRGCLDSVLGQDYGVFEVIAVNDRSGDETGEVMESVAARSGGRLRVVHITELPAGWLGKCYALHVGAREARGEWLLFVDSDVTVAPDALRSVLALAVNRGYDAVSLMTRLQCESALEKLVLPLAAASVSSMCLVSFTNDDRMPVAFANGQFLLIRRSVYERVGGHEAVKDHITEDVALMRLMKRSGARVRLYLGRHFAATRMHSTWKQMRNGWGRIFSGVSGRRPWRIMGAAVFVLSGLLAYAAMAGGLIAEDGVWFGAGAAHLAVVSGVVGVLYHWSGNARMYAVLYPLSAGLLLALYAHALRMCATGRVAWRGTSYVYGGSGSGTAAGGRAA